MLMHEQLKAKPWTKDVERLHGGSIRWSQFKLDGHRLLVFCDGNRNLRCYSSTWERLEIPLGFCGWMENLRAFPAGTSIDGELYVPGKPASYVKTAIKEQDEYLAFVPFAVPYYRGEDLTAEGLHRACDLVVGKGLPFSPYKAFDEVLEGLPFNPADELAAAVADGQEGVVFKQSNYAGWWKLKEDRTIDLIVTGVKAGKGKYQGLIGSLVCAVSEGHEVATVSGMTDAARREMTADLHRGGLSGRICEVKFQLVGSRGRLRHPRFLRWREDKLPEDCGLAQDIELLEKWSSEK